MEEINCHQDENIPHRYRCGNCGALLSYDDDDPAYGQEEICEECGIYNHCESGEQK